jgi:hypothetical protein
MEDELLIEAVRKQIIIYDISSLAYRNHLRYRYPFWRVCIQCKYYVTSVVIRARAYSSFNEAPPSEQALRPVDGLRQSSQTVDTRRLL